MSSCAKIREVHIIRCIHDPNCSCAATPAPLPSQPRQPARDRAYPEPRHRYRRSAGFSRARSPRQIRHGQRVHPTVRNRPGDSVKTRHDVLVRGAPLPYLCTITSYATISFSPLIVAVAYTMSVFATVPHLSVRAECHSGQIHLTHQCKSARYCPDETESHSVYMRLLRAGQQNLSELSVRTLKIRSPVRHRRIVDCATHSPVAGSLHML